MLDICKFNMGETVKAIQNWRNLTITKKRLEIGRHQLFVLKNINGCVTTNVKKAVKVAEKFYAKLYSDQMKQEVNGVQSDLLHLEEPSVTTDGVKKALKRMNKGVAEGDDSLTTNLITDACNFMINNLAQIFKNA